MSKVREIAQKVLGDVLDVSVVGGLDKSIKGERGWRKYFGYVDFSVTRQTSKLDIK